MRAESGGVAAGRDVHIGTPGSELAALIAQAIAPLVEKAHAAGVTEARIRALAGRIVADVKDLDHALAELERAVEVAIEVQARGHARSNTGDFVDAVLARMAELSAAGRDDEAAAEADRAFAEWEARQKLEAQKGIALLEAGLRADILRRDAASAAARIYQRIRIENRDPAAHFDALAQETGVWYTRGREKGLNFDLEIAIELSRIACVLAPDIDRRGAAWNDLGLALAALGDRERGTARLDEAVAAYGAALEEWTRERVPLAWAQIQVNLGIALRALGARERGTARLEEAVGAYRAALEELTRERVPLEWARTQMNLGNALQGLADRESGTARLEDAVAAYRAALEERTRERMPLEWAQTQMNLGNALARLGERESGTARLEEAVAAYDAALEEWTRDRVPLEWARTQRNLGNALLALGLRGSGTTRLERAVAAYGAALTEWTGERVPLERATATGGQGLALLVLAERTGSVEGARAGLSQLRESVAALRDGGHVPWAENFERQVPAAELMVARLEGG